MKTEDKIVEKAIDLFARDGFVKASVRDIVRSVGVTNATFYLYFKTKEDLLLKIVERIGTVLIDALEKIIEEEHDPVKCLEKMIYKHVYLVKVRWKEVKIYMEEFYQLSETLKKKVLKQHRQIYDIYKQKIQELKEKRFVDSTLNDAITVFAIFSIINWTYRWFSSDGTKSIDEVANQIVKIYFKGITQCKYKLE